jgi:uncharacterized protein
MIDRGKRVIARTLSLLAMVCWLAASTGVAASTALIEAVKIGNHDAARMLIAGRAVDVNASEADGMTALHWATRADDLEAVDLLIRAGAAVNAANRYGVTPLSLAATNGSGPVSDRLLEAGADPNAANPDGETVLMTASRTGNAEVVRSLLAHGADVHVSERWFGETALMWAAAENQAEVVKLLVAHGADIDRLSRRIELPKVKVDLATMVSTAEPKGGLSALMLAARQGAREAVRALIESGAGLDVTDPDGTSALVLAIINAHNDVAAVLIEGGADPNVADVTGMAALYAAIDMHTLDPLINRPPPIPSGELDSVGLVQLLLEHGADPNARLKSPLLQRQHNAGNPLFGAGATPLMRAARSSDLAMMRLLLEHGADATLATANGATSLMFAAGLGRNARRGGTEQQALDAITLCLDHGADVNAADQNGQTPLHVAVQRGDAVVTFLVERGARLDARDKFGRTPLDVALGVPAGAGRGGRPPEPGPVRTRTAALLRDLMTAHGLPLPPSPER